MHRNGLIHNQRLLAFLRRLDRLNKSRRQNLFSELILNVQRCQVAAKNASSQLHERMRSYTTTLRVIHYTNCYVLRLAAEASFSAGMYFIHDSLTPQEAGL
jgi:hypothetical protein